MSSTISNFSSNIDVQFPVPGQDNDTTGFRSNFSNIQQALKVAATEITDLEIIQTGIASQLAAFTFPDIVTATTIISSGTITVPVLTATNIVSTGTVFANVITATSNIITAGKFIGDGSSLTNITSVGTQTNIFVTANLNIGIAVISTTNNYLNISGVTQLYFADHGYSVVPKVFTTSTTANTITLNYSNGRYQTVTIDVTSKQLTDLKVTNWPTTGNHAGMLVEVAFTGTTSAFVANTEFRNSCTTYGSTSTTVSIDDWLGSNFLGTQGLLSGYGVFSSSTITTSTAVLTTINSVVDSRTITVFPGYNFVKGTTYYFAPIATSLNQLYQVRVTATSVSQTIKLEQKLEPTKTYNIANRAVYHLYSTDGGTTIYFNRLDVYNS